MAQPAPWRCYLAWPPGHRWKLVTEDRQSFLRCERCGKRRSGTFRPPPERPYVGPGD